MTEPRPRHCSWDPLTAFMAHYAGESSVRAEREAIATLPVDERLARRIIDGDAVGLVDDLDMALRTHEPLAIINDILLGGMKTVGELFGSGQMQLPFVLQSAETMKQAVRHLERFMDRVDGTQKGTMVLATVKGDVHDIGKNLVDIILTNNGYKVVNLGIKVPVETMLTAAAEHRADAIGMSGLLVKSTLVMKENLELMRSRGIRTPVVLGGAALTRRFVEGDLRSAYGAEVSYAGDAFDGLAFMERVMAARSAGDTGEAPGDDSVEQAPTWSAADEEVFAERAATAGAAMDMSMDLQRLQERAADAEPRIERGSHERPLFAVRSAVASDAPVPAAPFLGSVVSRDIHIDQVFSFINETALFRGQWQLRRGRRSEEEYARQVAEEIRPIFDRVKLTAKRERVLEPAVVHGYFPCASDGDEVIVYRPRDVEGDALHGRWPKAAYAREELVEWQRFVFPRQRGDRYLCLADYFRATTSDALDVCAFSVVTMGHAISTHTKALFESNQYQEYLYMHGLGVECAEALAEYWHKVIRTELGIAGGDAPALKALFSQGYQGSRFSFGYPACPRLEDQVQLFALLAPERIGVTLTEEYQLVPEQSTSAIVVHHPEAKYFAIR